MNKIFYYILICFIKILLESTDYIIKYFVEDENLKVEHIILEIEKDKYEWNHYENGRGFKKASVNEADNLCNSTKLLIKIDFNSNSKIRFKFNETLTNINGALEFFVFNYKIDKQSAVLFSNSYKSYE